MSTNIHLPTATYYSKSNCPACDEAKKLLPKSSHVNCDDYLKDADEFLDLCGPCAVTNTQDLFQ